MDHSKRKIKAAVAADLRSRKSPVTVAVKSGDGTELFEFHSFMAAEKFVNDIKKADPEAKWGIIGQRKLSRSG